MLSLVITLSSAACDTNGLQMRASTDSGTWGGTTTGSRVEVSGGLFADSVWLGLRGSYAVSSTGAFEYLVQAYTRGISDLYTAYEDFWFDGSWRRSGPGRFYFAYACTKDYRYKLEAGVTETFKNCWMEVGVKRPPDSTHYLFGESTQTCLDNSCRDTALTRSPYDCLPPPSCSLTPSPTRSRTPTTTVSRTPSPTRSQSPLPTASRSRTPDPTRSMSPTPTESQTPMPTRSMSPSPTTSPSPVATPSHGFAATKWKPSEILKPSGTAFLTNKFAGSRIACLSAAIKASGRVAGSALWELTEKHGATRRFGISVFYTESAGFRESRTIAQSSAIRGTACKSSLTMAGSMLERPTIDFQETLAINETIEFEESTELKTFSLGQSHALRFSNSCNETELVSPTGRPNSSAALCLSRAISASSEIAGSSPIPPSFPFPATNPFIHTKSYAVSPCLPNATGNFQASTILPGSSPFSATHTFLGSQDILLTDSFQQTHTLLGDDDRASSDALLFGLNLTSLVGIGAGILAVIVIVALVIWRFARKRVDPFGFADDGAETVAEFTWEAEVAMAFGQEEVLTMLNPGGSGMWGSSHFDEIMTNGDADPFTGFE